MRERRADLQKTLKVWDSSFTKDCGTRLNGNLIHKATNHEVLSQSLRAWHIPRVKIKHSMRAVCEHPKSQVSQNEK